MAYWDLLLTGGIVFVAVLYLYRVFLVKKGCSCGSSSCSSASAKHVKEEQQVEKDAPGAARSKETFTEDV